MERKRHESDDNYWDSAHAGFSFDEEWSALSGDSRLSKVLRENDTNEVDLLRSDGLTEIAENKSTKESSSFSNECGKNASELAKSYSPFITHIKINSEEVKCGPEDTIKCMILGLEYSLQEYKDKIEKKELLSAAVKSHDGNTILAVVLYLRETLKKSIFQREIMKYPDAVNVYLSYLEEDHETDELTNMLLLLDKVEDAAIFKYEAAVIAQHPERKLKWIENCLSTHFQVGSIDPFLSQSVEEHKKLLGEEINLEKNLSQFPAVRENSLFYERLSGKKSVVDSSVMYCFIFCCLNYYNSGEVIFSNPEKIKSNYNLSKKQYTWAALRAMAVSKKWTDIDNLFKSKNWLGGTKLRSCIAYSRILEILAKARAPNEVLNKYVSCIEDEEEKLDLAKKYGCHAVAIEIFKNNKDRIRLLEYKANLPPHSVDFCTASDILNNSVIRWKN